MSIGSRIKERREELGITQQQLAASLGVSKGAVGNYETDANSPKASIMYKVFDVLKCDANYLYQDEMTDKKSALPEDDRALLLLFHKLNAEGQEKLLGYADDLVQSEKYIKTDPAKLGREA